MVHLWKKLQACVLDPTAMKSWAPWLPRGSNPSTISMLRSPGGPSSCSSLTQWRLHSPLFCWAPTSLHCRFMVWDNYWQFHFLQQIVLIWLFHPSCGSQAPAYWLWYFHHRISFSSLSLESKCQHTDYSCCDKCSSSSAISQVSGCCENRSLPLLGAWWHCTLESPLAVRSFLSSFWTLSTSDLKWHLF